MADAVSAGIISFDVDGRTPTQAVARLADQRIVASESPYAFKCARVSPGILNTPADIEALLRAVRAMATG